MAISVKNSWARFTATAGETLALGDVVCLKDSDGKAYKADANDAALRPAVGIVSRAAALNATAQITVLGALSGYTNQAEGGPVYLSETAGETTQTPPTWAQQIGWAISAIKILFNFARSGA
jgi:hypothetical protein